MNVGVFEVMVWETQVHPAHFSANLIRKIVYVESVVCVIRLAFPQGH